MQERGHHLLYLLLARHLGIPSTVAIGRTANGPSAATAWRYVVQKPWLSSRTSSMTTPNLPPVTLRSSTTSVPGSIDVLSSIGRWSACSQKDAHVKAYGFCLDRSRSCTTRLPEAWQMQCVRCASCPHYAVICICGTSMYMPPFIPGSSALKDVNSFNTAVYLTRHAPHMCRLLAAVCCSSGRARWRPTRYRGRLSTS